MSEQIDWSKAPEGAIGHGNIGAGHFCVWFSDRWYEYVDINHGGRHYFGDTCTYKKNDIVSVTYRPTTPSWSGEGLPPVGVVCEVDWCEEWHKCEVIAHFQQRCGMVAAFTVEISDGAKSLDAFGADSFRPIRTPEQIAAERPTTPSWSGEGLPPVGVDIEVLHELYDWIGARVVGQDGEAAIVRTNDGYAGVFRHQMRPIRTTEQIEADERDAAIKEIGDMIASVGPTFRDQAARLYDAGFRKT